MPAFQLTHADRAVWGVSLRKGRLRIRPTLPCRVLALTLIALSVGLFAPAVSNRRPSSWFRFAGGLVAAVGGWRSWVPVIEATDTELIVKNHWSHHQVALVDVERVVVEDVLFRRSTMGYSPRRRQTLSVGLLELRSGPLILADALTSVPRREGRAAGHDRTATDIKVAALNRWTQRRAARSPKHPNEATKGDEAHQTGPVDGARSGEAIQAVMATRRGSGG